MNGSSGQDCDITAMSSVRLRILRSVAQRSLLCVVRCALSVVLLSVVRCLLCGVRCPRLGRSLERQGGVRNTKPSECYSKKDLLEQYGYKSLEDAEKLSWYQTAEQTMAVYEKKYVR